MKWTKWRSVGLLLVAGILVAGLWAFAPRPLPVESAVASRGSFETVIEEDAKTRVRDRYTMSAPLAGHLQRIRLRPGDVLEADTVAAVLTPMPAPLLDARSLREQEARVGAAEAILTRTETRIARARIAVQQAHADLQRSERLVGAKLVPAADLERLRLALEAAQRELDSAAAERHVAEHELEQARAALASVRTPTADGMTTPFELRTPVTGRVLRVLQESEGSVAAGTPLLEIGDLTAIEVVAELLTTDALRTPLGAPVRIEGWGGEQALEGRVSRIEPAAYTKVSALGVEEQRVRVLIDILSPAEQRPSLGDGFRVSVAIITQALDAVLCVPVSAVFPAPAGGSGELAVFRLEQGRARLVPIKVGARNAREAWITEGLSEGDRVIVYPGDAISDGMRVTERASGAS